MVTQNILNDSTFRDGLAKSFLFPSALSTFLQANTNSVECKKWWCMKWIRQYIHKRLIQINRGISDHLKHTLPTRTIASGVDLGAGLSSACSSFRVCQKQIFILLRHNTKVAKHILMSEESVCKVENRSSHVRIASNDNKLKGHPCSRVLPVKCSNNG